MLSFQDLVRRNFSKAERAEEHKTFEVNKADMEKATFHAPL